MTTNAAEKIERWHADLPAVLRAAVEGLPIHQIIFDIGKHHGLTIERLGFLAEEIARFVSGRTDAAGFLSSLQSALGGNRTQTAAVAREVNAKVFTKIREALLEASTASLSPPPVRPPAPPPAPPKLQRGEPPTRPMPPPSAPEANAAPAAPGKPEPLIIRPLPSQPREAADSGQRIADREQPVASKVVSPAPAARTAFEQKPAAPMITKPAPLPAPKALEALPPRAPERPAPPQPAAIEPAAPVISPLGMRPPQEKREIKKDEPKQQDSEMLKPVPPVPVVPPSTPPKPEPYQPPPPAQAYERAREAFQRELASTAAGQQAAQPETRPVPGVSVPPAPLGTTEALRREIEKFRQAGPDAQPRHADGAPPAPPVPKPLKLPTEKIPKPQAPERYDIDPYKEAPE